MIPVAPFDVLAANYDRDFTNGRVGRIQRGVVRRAFLRLYAAASPMRILEINCGAGEDACWLAGLGHTVVATDQSGEMIATLKAKLAASPELQHRIVARVASFDDLHELVTDAPFDLIFSNFGGLNCIDSTSLYRLGQVLASLLHPRGRLIAVVMGRFCWIETLYFLLKGDTRSAWRRRRKSSVSAALDAQTRIDIWYYSPAEFSSLLPGFQTIAIKPVGFWSPPSYLEPMLRRLPFLTHPIAWLERLTERISPLSAGADHYWWVGTQRG